jgi:hypothetical protein
VNIKTIKHDNVTVPGPLSPLSFRYLAEVALRWGVNWGFASCWGGWGLFVLRGCAPGWGCDDGVTQHVM